MANGYNFYEYSFESPCHYFIDMETEIEIDYVDLLADIESSWYANQGKTEDYQIKVVSITWEKNKYTKEENKLIKETLENPEKRKEHESKIIREFEKQNYNFDNQ